MKIDVRGTGIAYDVQGAGPALLFLHAFPFSKAMWERQATSFADRFRVVRFDARGFGESGAGTGPLTMDEIAEAAARVLDAVSADKAIVAGLSLGGYAALAFVRGFGARVRGLVLADTRAGADSDEAKKNRAALAEKVRERGAVAAVEAMLPKLLGATSHQERPEVVSQVEAWMRAAPPEAIANALGGLAARPDSTPTLASIQVPTLVVCGEEDALTPVADAEILHRGIAGSRLVVLPKAGHLSNVETPEAFDRAVGDFLKGLGG